MLDFTAARHHQPQDINKKYLSQIGISNFYRTIIIRLNVVIIEKKVNLPVLFIQSTKIHFDICFCAISFLIDGLGKYLDKTVASFWYMWSADRFIMIRNHVYVKWRSMYNVYTYLPSTKKRLLGRCVLEPLSCYWECL